MAIQNEMFKFIAEIELNEETIKKFTQGLKMANDRCDELRKTIAENQKDLMKMSAAGKENTAEFKALKKELADNTANLKKSSEQANKYASALGVNKMTANQLKASTKLANQYARALGLNQMTYNQLKAHASKLRKELNSLHKESNPISRKARKLSTKPCTRVSPRISPLPGQTLSWLTLPLSHRKKTRKGSYKWQT